jgi:Neutral/alkaline non-lysosomal ceramidase, N-terminal
MQFGFSKQDITPRLGVELYGYSGYLNRYAKAVRDPLHARSMAVRQGTTTLVLVSCDLVFVTRPLTAEVRRRVHEATGIDQHHIMVHATHTHSGPCIQVDYQDAYDPAYMELLPRRIAKACIEAVGNLQPARLSHAEVPCEGMGVNRVYDAFNHGTAALVEGFLPDKPELTDTTCHVLKVDADGRMLGFLSYFGCHNVVGGPECTYIHGDYAGIATGLLERESPGSVGVFLQGAEGDVNTAGCCFGDDKVLNALDVMAGRYARAVRSGLSQAGPVDGDEVRAARKTVAFSREPANLAALKERLAEEEKPIDQPGASDADQDVRWAVLRSRALRDIIQRVERGEPFDDQTEVQGFRMGPVSLLAGPFEIFQAIKNEVVASARSPIPLVVGLANDEQGYAVDRTAAQDEADYAAKTVPLWKHTLPYRDVHGDLVGHLLDLDAQLNG